MEGGEHEMVEFATSSCGASFASMLSMLSLAHDDTNSAAVLGDKLLTYAKIATLCSDANWQVGLW